VFGGRNINRTAELLYCHRNAVRHRLERVEALTGHSLSEPRGIAETLISVQSYRLSADDNSD
jgi:DNA-binding PucR family transcriptional regulator